MKTHKEKQLCLYQFLFLATICYNSPPIVQCHSKDCIRWMEIDGAPLKLIKHRKAKRYLSIKYLLSNDPTYRFQHFFPTSSTGILGGAMLFCRIRSGRSGRSFDRYTLERLSRDRFSLCE